MTSAEILKLMSKPLPEGMKTRIYGTGNYKYLRVLDSSSTVLEVKLFEYQKIVMADGRTSIGRPVTRDLQAVAYELEASLKAKQAEWEANRQARLERSRKELEDLKNEDFNRDASATYINESTGLVFNGRHAELDIGHNCVVNFYLRGDGTVSLSLSNADLDPTAVVEIVKTLQAAKK